MGQHPTSYIRLSRLRSGAALWLLYLCIRPYSRPINPLELTLSQTSHACGVEFAIVAHLHWRTFESTMEYDSDMVLLVLLVIIGVTLISFVSSLCIVQHGTKVLQTSSTREYGERKRSADKCEREGDDKSDALFAVGAINLSKCTMTGVKLSVPSKWSIEIGSVSIGFQRWVKVRDQPWKPFILRFDTVNISLLPGLIDTRKSCKHLPLGNGGPANIQAKSLRIFVRAKAVCLGIIFTWCMQFFVLEIEDARAMVLKEETRQLSFRESNSATGRNLQIGMTSRWAVSTERRLILEVLSMRTAYSLSARKFNFTVRCAALVA